ncbi:hypothetical protein DN730_02530 [Marinomonas piezotolerans]|uniref:Elongation factor P hydroxylase n=1 Tax=Marinomonas piezotolerans TaxID=2213058 RepID=A0A370UDT0_9GAMM|nr:elongation factor P hydroxylase [Marinomonas piezotolerans]RDL45946.1 hypothetical protein DN730_02530 [Marinomonas piezotolerans]
MLTVDILEKTFSDVFFDAYKTQLVGGFDEPFYLAHGADGIAQIQYRYDYLSSALHEISHWCVAGAKRRQIDDYGYWYAEDGRTLEQQVQFEHVEIVPQAYECLFHWSSGLPFEVSVDNLSLAEYDASPFKQAVQDHVGKLLNYALPIRVAQFSSALYKITGIEQMPLKEFLRECYENNCR